MIKCNKNTQFPDPAPGHSQGSGSGSGSVPGQGPSQNPGYAPGVTPGTPGAGPGSGGGGPSPYNPDLTVGGEGGGGGGGGSEGGEQSGNEPRLRITKGMSCAGPSLPKTAEDIMSGIQTAVGTVCSMGCFLKMLILSAREDLNGFNIELDETIKSLQTMMIGFFASNMSSLVGAGNYALGVLSTIKALLGGVIEEVSDVVDNFTNILKSMIVSVVMQSLGALVMAIAQNLITAMKQDLQNRIDIIEDIKTDNGLIRREMQSVSGMGFWDDLKKAIIAARSSVRSAKRNLISGYSNLSGGESASPKIEAAERNVWQSVWHLSSDKEKEALLSTSLEDTGAWSIEWDALNIYKGGASQMGDNFSEVWEAIQRIASNYTCLIRIGGRLATYQTALLAVEKLVNLIVNWTDENYNTSEFIGASLSFKIPGISSTLEAVGFRLNDIETSMNEVIDNEQKFIAPVMSETWKTELNALRYLLGTLIGGIPLGDDLSLSLLNPENLVISPQASQLSVDALNDFNAIMYPEYEGALCITNIDFTQRKYMVLAESFINLGLTVPNIIFSFDSWREDSINFDDQMSRFQDSDMATLDLIARFSGYEHDSFEMLSYLIEQVAGEDAVESLERADLASVLSVGADYLGPISSSLNCLGVVLEGFDINTNNLPAMLRIEIEEKMAVIFGDARLAQRSAMSLPAIQYNVISDLQKIILDKIADVGSLVGRLQRGCPE